MENWRGGWLRGRRGGMRRRRGSRKRRGRGIERAEKQRILRLKMSSPTGVHRRRVGRVETVEFLDRSSIHTKTRVIGRIGFGDFFGLDRIRVQTGGSIATLVHIDTPRSPPPSTEAPMPSASTRLAKADDTRHPSDGPLRPTKSGDLGLRPQRSEQNSSTRSATQSGASMGIRWPASASTIRVSPIPLQSSS